MGGGFGVVTGSIGVMAERKKAEGFADLGRSGGGGDLKEVVEGGLFGRHGCGSLLPLILVIAEGIAVRSLDDK